MSALDVLSDVQQSYHRARRNASYWRARAKTLEKSRDLWKLRHQRAAVQLARTEQELLWLQQRAKQAA